MFKDIRKKPKQTRQQFAFWYAVGLTAVVAFIWVLSLQYRLDTSTLTEDGVDTHTGAFAQFLNEAKENFATAFSAFGTSTEPASEEEVAEPVATSTQFILTPRATTTEEEPKKEPRRVRVEPASSATSSGTAEQ